MSAAGAGDEWVEAKPSGRSGVDLALATLSLSASFLSLHWTARLLFARFHIDTA